MSCTKVRFYSISSDTLLARKGVFAHKKKSKASLPCSRNNLYILCYIAYLIMKSAARIHIVMEIFLNLPVNALRTT